MPKEFVASELTDGTLVNLLPDWHSAPNVRLFIEFIVKAFQLMRARQAGDEGLIACRAEIPIIHLQLSVGGVPQIDPFPVAYG